MEMVRSVRKRWWTRPWSAVLIPCMVSVIYPVHSDDKGRNARIWSVKGVSSHPKELTWPMALAPSCNASLCILPSSPASNTRHGC